MPLIIPYSFGTAGLNTPTTQLDGNNTAIANWVNARTPASGNLAARPAAGNVGAMYSAVDQNNQLYLDTGTAWVAVSAVSAPSPYATLAGQATVPPTPVSPNLIVYVPTGPGADLTILDEQGVSRVISSVLFRPSGNPLSNVTNTTAWVSIFPAKPVIKANTLIAGRVLRVLWFHFLFNNSGANRGVQMLGTVGGQNISNVNTALITGLSPWASTGQSVAVHMEYLLTNIGVGTNQLWCWAKYWYSSNAVASQPSTSSPAVVSEYSNITFNPAIDNIFDIQVAFDVASPNAALYTLQVLAELL
jgi:hypothetical protein